MLTKDAFGGKGIILLVEEDIGRIEVDGYGIDGYGIVDGWKDKEGV